MIIGLFALAGISPFTKAVADGKVAGKFVFEVIDRKPMINTDNEASKKVDLDGLITFIDVDFSYPTRSTVPVLTNFNATFEKGKTTAIVGPSGAGKSSIVQLIERFYDPVFGTINFDGNDSKRLNLKHLRSQIGYVS